MKKRKRKNKIPKNKDIEEVVEKEDLEQITTMENAIKTMDKQDEEKTQREKFLDTIKVVEEDKKSKNIMDRKNAELKDAERKCAYIKAMNKILEEKEDTLEI